MDSPIPRVGASQNDLELSSSDDSIDSSFEEGEEVESYPMQTITTLKRSMSDEGTHRRRDEQSGTKAVPPKTTTVQEGPSLPPGVVHPDSGANVAILLRSMDQKWGAMMGQLNYLNQRLDRVEHRQRERRSFPWCGSDDSGTH